MELFIGFLLAAAACWWSYEAGYTKGKRQHYQSDIEIRRKR